MSMGRQRTIGSVINWRCYAIATLALAGVMTVLIPTPRANAAPSAPLPALCRKINPAVVGTVLGRPALAPVSGFEATSGGGPSSVVLTTCVYGQDNSPSTRRSDVSFVYETWSTPPSLRLLRTNAEKAGSYSRIVAYKGLGVPALLEEGTRTPPVSPTELIVGLRGDRVVLTDVHWHLRVANLGALEKLAIDNFL
jgi:hypothetical protein